MTKRISHLGIAVKDLAASEALFAKLLGGENIHHEVIADQGVSIASFKIGESIIELTASMREDSSIAKFIRRMNDSNSSSSYTIKLRLVIAMAACDAKDSTRLWSAFEKGTTAPVCGCWALINCSTPMTLPSWSFMCTAKKD